MLIEQVRSDLHKATKNRDMALVGALRMLVSALEYLEKRGGEFSKDDELAVVKSEVKKRKEAIEAYEKAGHESRAAAEKAELEVISEYMPQQASEEEVRLVVKKMISEIGGEINRGQLIGRVIGQIGKDKVDGTVVAKVVNEVLE